MGARGWEYVRGRGYVRVYVERDRAREIEEAESFLAEIDAVLGVFERKDAE